jgi:hypothetical protein
MLEAGSSPTEYELEHESKRLSQRPAFTAYWRLWRLAAIVWGSEADKQSDQQAFKRGDARRPTTMLTAELLETVHKHQLPSPTEHTSRWSSTTAG